MELINDGIQTLRQLALDQWQDDYPTSSHITADILANNSYILSVDEKIIATVALVSTGETIYNQLQNGLWQSGEPYLTIHRLSIARHANGQGYGSQILQLIEQIAQQKELNTIRLDTYEENIPMKKLAEKNGYHFVGTITYSETVTCLAYDKLLEDII